MNSSGTGDSNYVIRLQLYRAFMDRYFPASLARATGMRPRQSVSGPDLSGYYTWSRHVASNFLSLATMFGQARLSPNEHGGFSVDQITGVASTPIEWRADREDRWIDAHGSSRVAAVRGSDRTLRYLAVDDSFPAAVLQPVPWHSSKSWNAPLYVGCLGALLLAVVAWPVAFLVRYRRERSARVQTHFALGYLASFLHAAVLLVWFWLISDIGGQIHQFNDSLNWLIRVMQVAAGIAAVITPLVLLRAVRVWNAPTHGTPTKIGYTLGALACCGAVWLTITFRLLPLGTV
jgi:hypothetical protein